MSNNQAIADIISRLEQTVPFANQLTMGGGIDIMVTPDSLPKKNYEPGPDYRPGDLVLHPYYDDSGLTDVDEVNLFCEWFDNMLHRLMCDLHKLGYEMVTLEDGSGNGLYYCQLIFRKR